MILEYTQNGEDKMERETDQESRGKEKGRMRRRKRNGKKECIREGRERERKRVDEREREKRRGGWVIKVIYNTVNHVRVNVKPHFTTYNYLRPLYSKRCLC